MQMIFSTILLAKNYDLHSNLKNVAKNSNTNIVFLNILNISGVPSLLGKIKKLFHTPDE